MVSSIQACPLISYKNCVLLVPLMHDTWSPKRSRRISAVSSEIMLKVDRASELTL